MARRMPSALRAFVLLVCMSSVQPHGMIAGLVVA